MTDNKVIKEFARKTLGCNCPEAVFQYIDCRTAIKVDENILLDYEINIGNRLLIFVAEIDKTDPLQSVISKLVQVGTTKRDEKKFNRFRLVLLTTGADDITEQATEIFNSHVTDEKVHIHVIKTEDFPMNLNKTK
jgi:hypothetical protein